MDATPPPPLPWRRTRPSVPWSWHDGLPLLIGSLLFCYPLGLYLLWVSGRFTLKQKIVLGTVLPFGFTMFMLFAEKSGGNGRPADTAEFQVHEAAASLASECFQARCFALGSEAARYKKGGGENFPTVIFVTRTSLDDPALPPLPEALRKFGGRLSESGKFNAFESVYVLVGIDALPCGGSQAFMGVPLTKGMLELRLPGSSIRMTDWDMVTDADVEQVFQREGRVRMREDAAATKH